MEAKPNTAPHRGTFADRSAAGRRLADALKHYKDQPLVVLAVPCGGVPVGFEIAKALGASLDLLFVRKLRAPAGPEFGLGAIVDGPQPQRILNPDCIDRWQIAADYIESEVRVQQQIIEAWKQRFRGERLPLPLAKSTVILVDDGIATGNTIRAGLKALELAEVGRKVLAVPVAPQQIVQSLSREVDEMVCLLSPADFQSIGFYYADFAPTTDDDVGELLLKTGSPVSGAVPGRGIRWGL